MPCPPSIFRQNLVLYSSELWVNKGCVCLLSFERVPVCPLPSSQKGTGPAVSRWPTVRLGLPALCWETLSHPTLSSLTTMLSTPRTLSSFCRLSVVGPAGWCCPHSSLQPYLTVVWLPSSTSWQLWHPGPFRVQKLTGQPMSFPSPSCFQSSGLEVLNLGFILEAPGEL